MAWWVAVLVAIAACGRSTPGATERCLRAHAARRADAAALCERAWQETHDVAAAVAGAQLALVHHDDAALARWVERAPANVEGARILHFHGQRQLERGERASAEATLRRALALRIGRDPVRAANTALALLGIVQSARPAEDTLVLARTAWEQAEASGDPLMRAMAAAALVEILVDLGELRTADAVIGRMVVEDSPVLHDIAEGRVQAARGRDELAAALFARAAAVDPEAAETGWRLNATLELIAALLRLDRIADAEAQLARARALVAEGGAQPVDATGRLAWSAAAIAGASGDLAGALHVVERALAEPSRDAARILLLTLRGDLLARRGDAAGAERAWQEAADEVERWRASIPNAQLRNSLAEHQRRALEAWFASAARRGDVDTVIALVDRMFRRALLDQLAARGEASTLDRVLSRLALDDEVAKLQPARHDLRGAPHHLAIAVAAAGKIWVVRRTAGRWSVAAIGERDAILALVDAHRRDVDDLEAAARLGAALFPPGTLPPRGVPLVVLLDRALADIALPGLRVGGTFLVEHAPIVELVAPDVLAPVPARPWTDAVVIGDPRGDLPGAAAEVAEVGALLGVTVMTGARATREALGRARDARILHLATHSAVEADGGRLAVHDGFVSSLELARMQLAPRLAVVATCRSQTTADPATSLVAALLASGAAGVVGAKRSLADDASRALVLALYRAGAARDPIAALAAAQRAAIAAGRPPRDWAAFSFFGTGAALASVPER